MIFLMSLGGSSSPPIRSALGTLGMSKKGRGRAGGGGL